MKPQQEILIHYLLGISKPEADNQKDQQAQKKMQEGGTGI